VPCAKSLSACAGFRVELSGAPTGWVDAIAGADVVERLQSGAVIELRDGTSEAEVLDAARAVGEVRHFSVVRPSLAQIFREAVGA